MEERDADVMKVSRRWFFKGLPHPYNSIRNVKRSLEFWLCLGSLPILSSSRSGFALAVCLKCHFAGAWRVWIFRDRRSRLEFKTVWIKMLCRSTSEPFSYSNEKLQKLFRKRKSTLFPLRFTRAEVKKVVFTRFVSNQTFHALLYLGIWTTVFAWVMFYAFKSTLCIIFCEVLCLSHGLQSRSTGNNLLMDRNQKLFSVPGRI